jgi:hypothetical protein
MSEVEEHTAAWHEARAADLLRHDATGYPPAPAPVDRARAHAMLAQSMRLGELTKAVERSRREAAVRGRGEARRSR